VDIKSQLPFNIFDELISSYQSFHLYLILFSEGKKNKKLNELTNELRLWGTCAIGNVGLLV
jgi:hypothetical protein